jgi:exonuclease VII small subunit
MTTDPRLDRLEAFLQQFEQTLADALARMESEDGDEKAAAGELATHLSELTEAVKKLQPGDVSALVAAIRELRIAPVIHNEVNVPQPLVHVMPAPPAERVVTFEVTIPGRHGYPDQSMKIVRTEKARE